MITNSGKTLERGIIVRSARRRGERTKIVTCTSDVNCDRSVKMLDANRNRLDKTGQKKV